MGLKRRLKSLRNDFDLALRDRISWRLPVESVPERDLRFRREIGAFLDGFDWKGALESGAAPRDHLRILDVGARNFAQAPEVRRTFAPFARDIFLHGIELDAHRRLTNFRTRRDYGEYYARETAGAAFHAADFLSWSEPAHVILLLNPFVTPEPLLAWGLPLRHFRPDAMFEHAARLIPSGGWLLLSNPSERERTISREYLGESFVPVQTSDWKPSSGCVQKEPRLGTLWRRR